jgi:hypothetical protein
MTIAGIRSRRCLARRFALTALLFAAESAAAEGEGESAQGESDTSQGASETARDEPSPPSRAAGSEGQTTAPASPPETTFSPGFRFRLYGDVDFALREQVYPSFRIGAVDFAITGDVSQDFSVVSENVLWNLANAGTIFDVDRLYLEWHPKPWFKLRVGRDHLMFGRYLPTLHHPLLFQLATARPAAVLYEREGGWLAAHQIGLEALGDVPIGDELDLRYAVGIGNGRGLSVGDILSTEDRNAWKALVAQVGLLPRSVPGLEIGVSGYVDRIPPGFTDATGRVILSEAVDEQIIGAHVVYAEGRVDAHAEGYYLMHQGRDTGLSSHLIGGFVQLGVSFGQWTPYARFDGVDRSLGDTFFNISGTATRVLESRAGVRYLLNDRAVFKLEYLRDFENSVHGATLQAAFGI